ncbi:MAG: hypothetical protein V2A77_00410 [Pseudomonadota bacterium]
MPSTRAQARAEVRPLRNVTPIEAEEAVPTPQPTLADLPRERPRLPEAAPSVGASARPTSLLQSPSPTAADGHDVLRIVGQLKGQLVALETTKRALERELSTAKRQVEHLAATNKTLREDIEVAGSAQAELLRLREENSLLEEEASDVLGRLEQLKAENQTRAVKLAAAAQENQAAAEQLGLLRAASTETELLRIKAEFIEKEKLALAEENAQLARECEQLKDESRILTDEVTGLRKSLKEIRESLLLVRDSSRSDYYDLG